MSTETITDLETLCKAAAEGKPVDPEVRRRVKTRAETVRREIFERQGYLNIAVDLIREVRMIVFDASVGLKRVLVEADSDKAFALQGDLI